MLHTRNNTVIRLSLQGVIGTFGLWVSRRQIGGFGGRHRTDVARENAACKSYCGALI